MSVEEMNMKAFNRLSCSVLFRTGIIVCTGIAILTLSSGSARRVELAAVAASIVSVPAAAVAAGGLPDGVAVRPFRVNVTDDALEDLRRRVAATQWPERETVTDATQGAQLATMQKLARYWATDYDWRR